MKRVISLVAAASLMLFATSVFAQMHVGAGYVNSTSVTKSGNTSNSSPSNGFYVGGGYDVEVGNGLTFTPGIYYSFLSASNSSSVLGLVNFKGTTTEHYLNVPLTISYGMDLSGARLFAFAGPTVSLGLASTTTLDANVLGGQGKGTSDNYDGTNYGRADILLGGGVGIDLMDMLRIKVGYDFGMLNRNTGSSDVTLHRNQLYVGAAYLF